MKQSQALVPAAQSLPLSYIAACKAVAECTRVDECKGWADKAAAVAAYARMVRNIQLEADAKRIRLRATRRIGEIIGANGYKTALAVITKRAQDGSILESNRKQIDPAVAQLPQRVRSQARVLARIPSSEFDEIISREDPPAPYFIARRTFKIGGAKRQNDKLVANRGASGISQHDRLDQRTSKFDGKSWLLDFMVDRQPVRKLPWREVKAWAKTRLLVAQALLLLGEGHDDDRLVGDCVDEAAADRALELTRKQPA
jgi:hypothetical protein